MSRMCFPRFAVLTLVRRLQTSRSRMVTLAFQRHNRHRPRYSLLGLVVRFQVVYPDPELVVAGDLALLGELAWGQEFLVVQLVLADLAVLLVVVDSVPCPPQD